MKSASQPPLPPPPPPPSRPNLRIVAIGIGVIVIVIVALFVLYSFLSSHNPSIVSEATVSQILGENYKLKASLTSTNITGYSSSIGLSILPTLPEKQVNLLLYSRFESDSGAQLDILIIQYSDPSLAATAVNNLKFITLFNGTPISSSGSTVYYVALGKYVMIFSQYNNYFILFYYVNGKGKMPTQQQFLDLFNSQINLL